MGCSESGYMSFLLAIDKMNTPHSDLFDVSPEDDNADGIVSLPPNLRDAIQVQATVDVKLLRESLALCKIVSSSRIESRKDQCESAALLTPLRFLSRFGRGRRSSATRRGYVLRAELRASGVTRVVLELKPERARLIFRALRFPICSRGGRRARGGVGTASGIGALSSARGDPAPGARGPADGSGCGLGSWDGPRRLCRPRGGSSFCACCFFWKE